jgi:hypothetical protein
LVLESTRQDFVARVRVVVLNGDDEAVLIDGASLFRLRGPRPAEKLRLPLPPFSGERLRIQIETEGSSWLEPAFRLESTRSFEHGGWISVPLDAAAVEQRKDKTVVTLVRPHGIVPELLRLETSTGSFDRKVEVWDEGPGSLASALGSENLFRVAALVSAGDQELGLRPSRGERLRVEIDDGDSPPLDELAFVAVIRQPALIFELPAAESGQPAGSIRFGGGRAHLPRYDLAGLLPERGRLSGKRAAAAAALFEEDALGVAHLGEIRPNDVYDETPALAFAMRPGAEIERDAFRYLRELQVPDATEGLSRLTLEPADLAVLNDNLSDLRIVDDESQQWPYLVEPGAVARLVPLEVQGPERDETESRYRLLLPVSRLPLQRLLLQIEAPYFDRAFRLLGHTSEDEELTLASGRLTRPIGDPRPVGVDVPTRHVTSLELLVEDGDDAALEIQSAQARVLLPDLFLTAPEGRYALLLGSPDQRAPRYELERVREVVLAVNSEPIRGGSLEPNPEFSVRARLRGTGLQQRVLLWAVLLAAVAVLGGLTLRLARRSD